jgi:hypothetical protein
MSDRSQGAGNQGEIREVREVPVTQQEIPDARRGQGRGEHGRSQYHEAGAGPGKPEARNEE